MKNNVLPAPISLPTTGRSMQSCGIILNLGLRAIPPAESKTVNPRSADFTRTCEGCPHIRSEEWDKKERMAFRCFAPGPNQGYAIGIERLLPYIPAWCPLQEAED